MAFGGVGGLGQKGQPGHRIGVDDNSCVAWIHHNKCSFPGLDCEDLDSSRPAVIKFVPFSFEQKPVELASIEVLPGSLVLIS